MGILVKPFPKFLLVVGLMAVCGRAADSSGVELDEFKAKMTLQFGHLANGEYRTAGRDNKQLSFVPLNRDIISLNQDGGFGDEWKLNAGLMGILWWPFSPTAGPPASRTVRVEPRISILKASHPILNDGSMVEFGYFPYKYNKDALNLGEYLYRSGTYPGVVFTGDGYQLMEHAYYDAFGIHFHFSGFDGLLSQDVNVFAEPTIDPLGDLTPGYEVSVNGRLFQFGIGAVYNHGISYRPSDNRPKTLFNAFIEVPADSSNGISYYKGPFLGAPSSIQRDTSKPYRVLHYWTQRGLKLDLRASLDLGFLLPEETYTKGELRLFGEVAILGWENQPYYYENRKNRMPIMFGLNIPTFKVLDVLSAQGEYYDAPFNDIDYFARGSLPIWKVVDYQTMDRPGSRSKWKWSVNGKKSINRLVSVHAQIANDHLRLRDFLTYYSEYEMTLHADNWYYLVQMEVGI